MRKISDLIGGAASSVWTVLRSKARLYIEYALIAAIIIVASWAAVSFVRNRHLEQRLEKLQVTQGALSTTVSNLQAANAAQQKAIDQVSKLREIDHGVLQALMDGVVDIYGRDAKIRKRINELRQNNEEAKKFLDTPAPPSVQCVLNHTPCTPASADQGGGAVAAPGVAESVPSTGKQADQHGR